MSRRSGLFGSRPDLLLVDERPRGIDLAAVLPTALPVLEDEPETEPDLVVEDEPAAEDDSYDGAGPLRIFIGSPKAEGVADRPPVIAGPVWDASALAAGHEDEDFDTDGDAEPSPLPRAPVLLKAPGAGPQPPPLTMSFGGSFARGSMDAGVMDEDSAAPAPAPSELRADTVVVHDQIYDRFLRFEDPLDTPPVRGPEVRMDDEPEEPLSVGAFDDDDAMDAMDGGAARVGVQAGPPPSRGLTVGFVPNPDLDDDVISFYDNSDAPDIADEDEVDEEDEQEHAPLAPRVIIGDHAPPTRAAPPPLPVPPPPVVRPPPPDEGDTDLDLGAPVEAPGPSRLAPDWADRRRDVQRTAQPPVALPSPTPAPAPAPVDDGGRMGLVVFALLAIAAILVTWYFLRGSGSPAAEAPTGSTSAVQEPVGPPMGADAVPEDGVQPLVPGDAPEAAPEATPAAPEVDAAAPVAGSTEGAEIIPLDADPTLTAPDGPTDDEGVLRIRATRPSRVYIDGRYVGQTPLPALALAGGSHDIRVVAIDSGRSRSQSVRVDAGRSQEVRFSF